MLEMCPGIGGIYWTIIEMREDGGKNRDWEGNLILRDWEGNLILKREKQSLVSEVRAERIKGGINKNLTSLLILSEFRHRQNSLVIAVP
jgi:hypothetical protein